MGVRYSYSSWLFAEPSGPTEPGYATAITRVPTCVGFFFAMAASGADETGTPFFGETCRIWVP